MVMGTGYNPRIVTENLVFCVDAANIRSYPKTGTTWSDLKGGNNGTLTNMDAANFSSDNAGSLSFHGSNEYVAYSATPLDFSSSDFSVECIFRTTAAGTHVMMGLGPTGGDWWLGIINGKLRFSISLPSSTIEPQTLSTVNENQWKIVLATIKNSTYEVKRYLNGSLSDTRSGTGSYPNSSNDFSVGKFGATSFYFPGDIACARIYNRVLSADEVRQNYLATKERYA